jgi:hypothetical protein
MSGKVEGHRGPGSFSFHGRAGQGEWLWAFGQSLAVGVFASFIPNIGFLIALPWTVRFIAVSTRRLHDMGLSGWLQLAPMALTAATPALFLAFQTYGLADYGPLLGEGNHLPGAEITMSELLSLPARHTNLLALPPLAALPMALYWLAAISYIVLYAGLLLVTGANGPNAFGEADRR